jgi:ribonuclease VapC
MVAETRHGEAGCRELDRIAANLGLEIVPFDASHIQGARDALRRFGKGRHRASLNFGDCCAYALAKLRDVPLLFKGNDFALTDLKRAL